MRQVRPVLLQRSFAVLTRFRQVATNRSQRRQDPVRSALRKAAAIPMRALLAQPPARAAACLATIFARLDACVDAMP
jgi:hypothetical protein